MAEATTTNVTPPPDTENTLSGIRAGYENAAQGIEGVDTSLPDDFYQSPTQEQKQEAGATTQDTSNYMTNDTSVAGQLSRLLSSDSPYLKQVDARSKLQANELGMLSSDRAIGAAQGAAIRESLPIAKADADTASKFGLQKQQADNTIATTAMEGLVSGALKAQQTSLDNASKKVQGVIDSYLQSAAMEGEVGLTNFKAEWNMATETALKELDHKLNKAFIEEDYKFQTAENARYQASSIVENTAIAIENLLKDPDILELGSDAVTQIVNNHMAIMAKSVNLVYSLAKLDPDSYTKDLLDGFSDGLNWNEIK